MNAYASIESTDAGIYILSSDEQLEKAFEPIERVPLGIVSSVREEQPENSSDSMRVIPEGREMLFRL